MSLLRPGADFSKGYTFFSSDIVNDAHFLLWGKFQSSENV